MMQQTLCKYTDRECVYPDIICEICPIYQDWLAEKQAENKKKGEGLFEYLGLEQSLIDMLDRRKVNE